MRTTNKTSVSYKFIIQWIVGLYVLSLVFVPQATVQAAEFCQCVKYIQNRYFLPGGIGTGGAKSMGPYLIERGFRKVDKPKVGAVVIFQPAFGAVDQDAGHVGVITKVVDKDTKWRIWVQGANQGEAGIVTEHNCNNVNNISYTAYLKSWGDDYISYYVPPKDFTSTFASDAAGWSAVNGKWDVSTATGFYNSSGLRDKFVSTKHSGTYSTLTYTVKMKRSGCSNCGNYIYFRGTPEPRNSDGRWNSGFVLEYSNNGYYTIGRQVNGEWVAFVDWTWSSSVTSGWNTLKVAAYGDYIEFFINDTKLRSGTYPGNFVGQVGIGFYQDIKIGTRRLYVNSAKLTTSVPSEMLSLSTIDTDTMITNMSAGELDETEFPANTSDPRMSP